MSDDDIHRRTHLAQGDRDRVGDHRVRLCVHSNQHTLAWTGCPVADETGSILAHLVRSGDVASRGQEVGDTDNAGDPAGWAGLYCFLKTL